jgi:hypothetical protein|tara:strand:+ start:3625 stop:3849 length:225 start_codon:yes stop_codon:yes gene_type:complete
LACFFEVNEKQTFALCHCMCARGVIAFTALGRRKRKGFDQCGLRRFQSMLLGALGHGTGSTIAFVGWHCCFRRP